MYNSYAGKERTNSNIAWHRPQSNSNRVEEELMKKSERALESTTDPLERLRLMLLARGAAGIMILGRIFRKIDEEDTNQISKEQFHTVIKESGLELSEEEVDDIFGRFDKENTGSIRLDDFIQDIRPPMSESRRAITEKAFRKFDHHGHNAVTVQDLRDVFSVTSNSRFTSVQSQDLLARSQDLVARSWRCSGQSLGSITDKAFRKFDHHGHNAVTVQDLRDVFSVTSNLRFTSAQSQDLLARSQDLVARSRKCSGQSLGSITDKAFRKFDHHGHNAVTVQDLRDVFSVTSNSRYMSGEESASTVMTAFLDNFETDGENDGKVNRIPKFLNSDLP
ncbi:EF-hand domain pair domain-containing protein [Phthorimaea operculella]|nr:EF-hand domain pair domain-containing protein [Phthorimaea operculella]